MDVNPNLPRRLPWHQYINIRELLIEPFVLLYMFGYSLSSMAVSQLVQDKLCRVDYGQSSSFCISINSADFDHGGETIKSNIIKNGAYITLYRTLLSTLPCIVWSVFLGPWSDNYVQGRKFIMIAGATAAALESLILIINTAVFHASAYFVLLSFLPSALSGGIIATMMAIYAYCSANSDKETRSTRFSIVEICFWIAQPIGSFIGGQILGNGDQNTHYQLYNYLPVFIFSFFAHLGGIFWIIFVINENIQQSNSIDTINIISNQDQDSYIPPHRVSFVSFSRLSSNLSNQFLHLFELNNVKEVWSTLTKKRSNWGRGQIWILFVSTAFLLIAYLNTTFVLWPYVEKLYSWPPKFYSNITSGVAIATLLLMGFVQIIFVRVFKFSDMRLAMFGVLSLMIQLVLRGSWQHETGLYLSFIGGTLAPLSLIGIRSRLSKIVDDDERGKLFALLATFEAISPVFASVIYSVIFSLSIDVYPGLVFQLAASIMLIPLLSILFIDVYCVSIQEQALPD